MAAVLAVAAGLFLAGHPWLAVVVLAGAAIGPHAHNRLEAAWWAATWRVRLALVFVPSAVAGAVFVSGWLALSLAAWGAWRTLLAALREHRRHASAGVSAAVATNRVTHVHHHRHYHLGPRPRRVPRPLGLALAIGRSTTAPRGAIDVNEAPAAVTGARAALPAPTGDDAIPAIPATTAQEAHR